MVCGLVSLLKYENTDMLKWIVADSKASALVFLENS